MEWKSIKYLLKCFSLGQSNGLAQFPFTAACCCSVTKKQKNKCLFMQKPENYRGLSPQEGKLQWNIDKRHTLICAAFNLSCDWAEFTGGRRNKSIITISLWKDLILSPCWDCGSEVWIQHRDNSLKQEFGVIRLHPLANIFSPHSRKIRQISLVLIFSLIQTADRQQSINCKYITYSLTHLLRLITSPERIS